MNAGCSAAPGAGSFVHADPRTIQPPRRHPVAAVPQRQGVRVLHSRRAPAQLALFPPVGAMLR